MKTILEAKETTITIDNQTSNNKEKAAAPTQPLIWFTKCLEIRTDSAIDIYSQTEHDYGSASTKKG